MYCEKETVSFHFIAKVKQGKKLTTNLLQNFSKSAKAVP
jgi:hypothetical protein